MALGSEIIRVFKTKICICYAINIKFYIILVALLILTIYNKLKLGLGKKARQKLVIYKSY